MTLKIKYEPESLRPLPDLESMRYTKTDNLPRIDNAIISEDEHAYLREKFEERGFTVSNHRAEYGMMVGSDPSVFRPFLDKLRSRASKAFGVPVLPTYSYAILYGSDAHLPEHTDQVRCEYTIGHCIRQDVVYPFWIEGSEFRMKEGQSILYSGTHQRHHRDRFSGEFCHLILFHFVDLRTAMSLPDSLRYTIMRTKV